VKAKDAHSTNKTGNIFAPCVVALDYLVNYYFGIHYFTVTILNNNKYYFKYKLLFFTP
jgi:hypothetical protein